MKPFIISLAFFLMLVTLPFTIMGFITASILHSFVIGLKSWEKLCVYSVKVLSR